MKKILPVLLSSLLLSACTTVSDKQADGDELLMPGGAAPDKGLPDIPSLPGLGLTKEPAQINNSGSLPGIKRHKPPAPKLKPVPAEEDIVILDYEQAELREIIDLIGDELGISMVMDTSIGGKVTMRTAPDKPLKRADLWSMLQLLLVNENISMEKKGKVYHLKKAPNSLPLEIGEPSKALTGSDSAEVLQITPLRYISLDSGLAAVKPLVEPLGRVLSLPTLNIIGIIAPPDRLRRINKLLSLIDADPFVHRGLRLFRLLNAKATEVQAELDKILKAVEGNNPAYQLIALERINGLLVVAPPRRGFEQVEQWINILDEENEAGGEQVFIYHVRNLEAGQLASTLSEVFKSEDEDEQLPQRQPGQQPDQPQQPAGLLPTQVPRPPQPAAQPAIQQGSAGTISAELKVTIVADEDTNSLIVRATPKDYRQLLSTITQLDKSPKEVLVNVVIAEVELTESTQFGIDWTVLLGDRSFAATAFDIPAAAMRDVSTGDLDFTNSGLVISQVGSRLTSVLNALATEGDVSLLSRPSILVRNNQEATINVGSDEPTISRTNSTSGVSSSLVTSNEVQYRETGIILKITPQINEDGVINMQVSQEVSQIGAPRTDQNLPSFTQRKIDTSVVVRSGTAIVLGGLMQTRLNNSKSGVPLLKDIPVVSPLFSSVTKQTVRTELVVIIVPQIIDPEADNRIVVRQFQERMKLVSDLIKADNTPLTFGTYPLPPPEEAIVTETDDGGEE